MPNICNLNTWGIIVSYLKLKLHIPTFIKYIGYPHKTTVTRKNMRAALELPGGPNIIDLQGKKKQDSNGYNFLSLPRWKVSCHKIILKHNIGWNYWYLNPHCSKVVSWMCPKTTIWWKYMLPQRNRVEIAGHVLAGRRCHLIMF